MFIDYISRFLSYISFKYIYNNNSSSCCCSSSCPSCPFSSSSSSDSLCGVHALNNLIQGPIITSEDMAAIAQELDDLQMSLFATPPPQPQPQPQPQPHGQEHQSLTSHPSASNVDGGEGSGSGSAASFPGTQGTSGGASFFRDEQVKNVDESGNFSLQTLKLVLQRMFGFTIENWSFRNDIPNYDPAVNEQGFIINNDKHWYAIRKIHDVWYKLDSLSDKPLRIDNLNLWLMVLKQENDSIFTCEGADVRLNSSCPWDYDEAPAYCLWFSVYDI